ncbi:MAG TPA: D-alanyl-D-alanine carboxypeptidase [Thiotrichaceae bacterium]|jgi:D-alanyl-D-alanine carboxypeptidase (penicillin-binding protein 5/6)|nr:D-alanyl-D-alanine carboxypeptidase [Thiotrichaceae bacterium]HIM07933.1 D-alanyl-D-alanine carboxypeptidase [Gammaproteobacteria bacterium]
MTTRLSKFIFIFIFFSINSQSLLAESLIVPAAPKIKASSYLVMDFNSGKLLVEENSELKLPPASLTKMMTVYVVSSELVNGKITLDDEVLVSEKAWRTQGSRMFIEVGKKVKLNDLLHGVIIQSGNDASVALAEYVSGTEDVFADLMNKHAQRLGMHDTHFVNSTGLPDENHYTTARDLAKLAQAMIKDFPEEYKLYKVKEFTFNKIKQHNRNKLLWRDHSVDGIKTGHTEEAGYCLVASAVKNGMRLISVVMGTDGVNARAKASQVLLSYGYRFFETHKLYSAGELITSVKIWKADVDVLNLGIKNDIYVTVARGQYDKLEPVVELDQQVIAPINEGEQKGTLNVTLLGENVFSVPLLALETISEGSIVNRLKDEVRLLFE